MSNENCWCDVPVHDPRDESRCHVCGGLIGNGPAGFATLGARNNIDIAEMIAKRLVPSIIVVFFIILACALVIGILG